MTGSPARRLVLGLTFGTLAAVGFVAREPARAKLTAPQRTTLVAYLGALQRGDFAAAFARLSSDERRYFGSAHNLEAVFAADRLALVRFTILESIATPTAGTVAVVRERAKFFDHASQRVGDITANVRYGIVAQGAGLAIKDPFHPWFAFAPVERTTSVGGVRVWVRKVSFFTGRVDLLLTFANTGESTVTILPYGRSLIRDETGSVHAPIRSKLPGLTDAALFEGLRLPPSARYTGSMAFFTADRFVPKRLELTLAPALVDGADAPFEFTLPSIDVPGRT